MVNPGSTEGQLLRKPYKNWYNPLYEYLILKPSMFSIKCGTAKDTSAPYTIFDVHNSGVPIPHKKDEYINKNKEEHVAHDKFNHPTWGSHYYNQTDQTIEILREINALCIENDISCTYFINPMHVRTYTMQNIDDFSNFLWKVGDISDFYDFSGINAVTTDNFCYYETSHFRPFIGDSIIDVLFHNKPSESGFGVRITKENIDSVLEIRKQRYNSYKGLSTGD